MGQRTLQADAHRARSACDRHHQLSSSGLGSLNGRGLARGLGLARGSALVCLGMGSCLPLGCCLHHASPTTSLTSTVPSCRNGVMQNHQRDLIGNHSFFVAPS